MCDELNAQLDSGSSLALQLVDHLESMGAGSCEIPVTDRSVEYVVIVIPKDLHEKKKTGKGQ